MTIFVYYSLIDDFRVDENFPINPDRKKSVEPLTKLVPNH